MSDFLTTPAPRWFTIPAHRPFLEADPGRGAYVAQVHGDFAASAQQRLRHLRDRP